MITGDQALPQPLESSTDVLLPSLPEAVLRREALIRSFRWISAVEVIAMLWMVGRVLHFVSQWGLGYMAQPALIWPTALCAFAISFHVAQFWALSSPQRLTRAVLIVGLLSALALECIWFLNARDRALDFFYWALYAFFGLPYLICACILARLAFSSGGRDLYSREGRAGFHASATSKRRENYWIGVAYLLIVAAQQFAIFWHETYP